jgi:threonine dehydrogenase-like Zn-dependent dehydrogenase
MSEPLDLIASGRFDPRSIETVVVGFDDAAAALAEPFTQAGDCPRRADPVSAAPRWGH